jgi:hypothetical protein
VITRNAPSNHCLLFAHFLNSKKTSDYLDNKPYFKFHSHSSQGALKPKLLFPVSLKTIEQSLKNGILKPLSYAGHFIFLYCEHSKYSQHGIKTFFSFFPCLILSSHNYKGIIIIKYLYLILLITIVNLNYLFFSFGGFLIWC